MLVLGAGGLVGRAVLRAAGAVRAPGAAVGAAVQGEAAGHTWIGVDRAACDVTDPAARAAALAAHRPDAVLFCAGFTDVDAAAHHPAAEAVNVHAPAAWAREVETWFLSSNFVFSGPGPHGPAEAPRPESAYGRQKVAAEEAVLAAGGHVVRVGWVYGPGGRTFASALEARLRAGERVRAIHDLVVQPTHADDLARALLPLPRGVTHLMGRDETTWYGYAVAIQAEIGRGAVEPVRAADLGLGPRPRDGRLAPADLPGCWSRNCLRAGTTDRDVVSDK